MNSTALLFVFLSFVVLLFAKKLRQTILIVVVFISIYSIWVIRNYMIFGEFILGSTVSGVTLYYSCVMPYEIAGTPEENEFMDKEPVFSKLKMVKDEVYANRYFLKSAINVIKSDYKEFFIRCLKRLIKLYRIYPHRGKNYAHSETLLILVSLFSYGILFPFFLISFFYLVKNIEIYYFIYLPLISFTLVYSLIWAVIRYRVPLEPYIIILGSSSLLRMSQIKKFFVG